MGKLLEVGDVIFYYGTLAYNKKRVIDRVTKTMAMTGNQKYKRETNNDGSITIIGRSQWDTRYACMWDQKQEDAYQKQLLLQKIAKIRFSDMSTDALEAILALSSPYNKTAIDKMKDFIEKAEEVYGES